MEKRGPDSTSRLQLPGGWRQRRKKKEKKQKNSLKTQLLNQDLSREEKPKPLEKDDGSGVRSSHRCCTVDKTAGSEGVKGPGLDQI